MPVLTNVLILYMCACAEKPLDYPMTFIVVALHECITCLSRYSDIQGSVPLPQISLLKKIN